MPQLSRSCSITWFGTLGGATSRAFDVSADGSVVVGQSGNIYRNGHAFRWTRETGLQDLGTLGGLVSRATGVSADGSVIVGWADDAYGQRRAFCWTAATGRIEDLGAGEINDISADGLVVVGCSGLSTGMAGSFFSPRAFRQTATAGREYLCEGEAFGVSADGSVVVGTSHPHAFRWTERGGIEVLDALPDMILSGVCFALDVSADGAVVVGGVEQSNGYARAFRWTSTEGMLLLDTLGGNFSRANGVSANGRVIVGWASNRYGQLHAFRWTPSRGMEDLNTTYADLLTDGSVLETAIATSSDGRYIVGWGANAATGRTEAFLLDTGYTL